VQQLQERADGLENGGLVALGVAFTQLALGLSVGETVSLARQMMEGSGEILDDQAIDRKSVV
jgi:hypothetical protein